MGWVVLARVVLTVAPELFHIRIIWGPVRSIGGGEGNKNRRTTAPDQRKIRRAWNASARFRTAFRGVSAFRRARWAFHRSVALIGRKTMAKNKRSWA